EKRDRYENVGEPHEAGCFKTGADAQKFIDDQLLMAEIFASRLRQLGDMGLKFLASLPHTELTSELQNHEAFRKMLEEAMQVPSFPVDDHCPKCGSGHTDRVHVRTEVIGIEAVHMYYQCLKCNSELIEEFTLSEVFIDDGK